MSVSLVKPGLICRELSQPVVARLIRRNFGANHLIVGRDHAGPGVRGSVESVSPDAYCLYFGDSSTG